MSAQPTALARCLKADLPTVGPNSSISVCDLERTKPFLQGSNTLASLPQHPNLAGHGMTHQLLPICMQGASPGSGRGGPSRSVQVFLIKIG